MCLVPTFFVISCTRQQKAGFEQAAVNGLLEQIERIPVPPTAPLLAHDPLNPFPKSVGRIFFEHHSVRPSVDDYISVAGIPNPL